MHYNEHVKKEVRALKGKAEDSLLLSVDHFNRVGDLGRPEAVLVLLDRSLELLLKACILHRGMKIRERGSANTIGFDACVRRGLSGAAPFLNEDRVIGLQALNGLRDAAQHYLLDISEEHLYMQAMSGVTLFRDIVQVVFEENLSQVLPKRALPLSTVVPTDVATLFENECREVTKLLQPGMRRQTEVAARMRALAILDRNIQGEKTQPSDSYLVKQAKQLAEGTTWEDLFPGAAAVSLTASGVGPELSLRIAKKEGIDVRLVPEGTPEASVIGVKRVNELDFYSLDHRSVASKLGLTSPKLTAISRAYNIEDDPDLFKRITVGKVVFKRYSPRVLGAVKRILEEESIESIWERAKAGRTR